MAHRVIDHKASAAMRLGPAGVRAGDLLCLSALYAADEEGAIPAARASTGLRYLGAPVQHQMRDPWRGRGNLCGQRNLACQCRARPPFRRRSQCRLYCAQDLARKTCRRTNSVWRCPHAATHADSGLRHHYGYVGLSAKRLTSLLVAGVSGCTDSGSPADVYGRLGSCDFKLGSLDRKK